jgi:tRNA pseudouridine65 synthase
MIETTTFPILFEDDDFIAINKPTGILVHRTRISEDTQFVLQLLRKQIGQRIYPIHRLDRGTSGVLIFGKSSEAASWLSCLFRAHEVKKEYLAIIRGFVADADRIDYPLAKEKWLEKKEAITDYQKIDQVEINVPISRYVTARYSLVNAQPQTGRRHQIRRHFAHIRHPVIGDKRHGDVKHNKHWQQSFDIKRMLLHAHKLDFIHPKSNQKIEIIADLDLEFRRALELLNFALG